MKVNRIKTLALCGTILALIGSGCGKKNTPAPSPTITVQGNTFGYYSNNVFCDFENNYCGTGQAYGIEALGIYSIYNNNYANNGEAAPVSWIYTPCFPDICPSEAVTYSAGVNSSGGNTSSLDSQTKDVDLQRADLQSDLQEQRAQTLASHFGMNIDSARQLSLLVDRMNSLTDGSGQISDEDRASLSDAAFSIAHISSDDVNAAIQNYIQNGDKSALDDLMEHAATNLGMPSSAGLRDEILPSLGINIQ